MKIINFGIIKIKPTVNNVFITLTDSLGNVILSKHSGSLKFKGSKKKTPYVAGLVVKELFKELAELDIKIKSYIVQIQSYIRNSMINGVMKQLKILRITLLQIEQVFLFFSSFTFIHACINWACNLKEIRMSKKYY